MEYDPTTRAGAWVTAKSRQYVAVAISCAFGTAAVLLALIAVRAPQPLLVVASFGGLLLMVGVVSPIGDLADRYRKGSVAEQAVGDALDGLRGDGFIVLHDVLYPRGGNIDHIVSGSTGVYLIETKFRRFEERQLGKAKQQALWLHDELGVWVTPVMCLAIRDHAPWTQKKVEIVPRQHLADWIKKQRNPPVDFDRLARFADGLN